VKHPSDRIEDRDGIDKLGDGSLVQAAAAHKVAIKPASRS
jgi:hypothetical protein